VFLFLFVFGVFWRNGLSEMKCSNQIMIPDVQLAASRAQCGLEIVSLAVYIQYFLP
jgi:hypothetical protein